jgi:cell shape-determining protein MreC
LSATEAAELDRLSRENSYLKTRNAQLQSDVTSLAAESQRLREELERIHGRRALRQPNPLNGGQ